MIYKILLGLAALGVCSALVVNDQVEDSPLPAHYSFAYNVQDHKTEDLKDHHEEYENGVTRGEYSLVEPDGTKRTVKYTVDGKSGFNAVVTREGHNIKETYTYGGDSGSSFEHKGNLVHDEGHSHQEHGSSGQSSLTYNRAEIKSSPHESAAHSYRPLQSQYIHHAPLVHAYVPVSQSPPQPVNHGGTISYYSSNHVTSTPQPQLEPKQVVHYAPHQTTNYGLKNNVQVIHRVPQLQAQLVQVVQPVILSGGHTQILHTTPRPIINQIVNQDGGQTYYNLNNHNAQKINQGASQLSVNENFHHPDRHDYRGKFGNRDSQAAFELRKQQEAYNAQRNAQPDLQQVYYNSLDQEQQIAQAVRPGLQIYNPQIHLANQINSYNQQQFSKAYQVKPMVDEQGSQGIVLFYGKDKKFSNQIGGKLHYYNQPQQYGTYVQFHNNGLQQNNIHQAPQPTQINYHQNQHYAPNHNQQNAVHYSPIYYQQNAVHYSPIHNQQNAVHYSPNHNQQNAVHYSPNNNQQNAVHYSPNNNQQNAVHYSPNNNQQNAVHYSPNNNQQNAVHYSPNNNQQNAAHYSSSHPSPHHSSNGAEGYATSFQTFAQKGANVYVSTKHILPKILH